MQVYYFISNLGSKDYDFFREKISKIKSSSDADRVIDTYTHQIGASNKDVSQRAAFMEACMFMREYISQHNGNSDDITWVYKENFLSYNDEVYIYIDKQWSHIVGDTLFVTSRDRWKHPFFYFLSKKSYSKNIYFSKPNLSTAWEHYDKLYFIQKVWCERQKFVGDVIIPFFMEVNDALILKTLKFVENKMGNKFILKSNFGVEGLAVRAINTDLALTHGNIKSIRTKFFNDKSIYSNRASYFTPFYKIKKEYRVYYTNFNEKVSIYSIKHKSYPSSDSSRIFRLANLSRNNIKINWEYCSTKKFESEHQQVKQYTQELIPKLGLHTGVLELCECDDGTLRFIEVNPLGGTLLFAGEDVGAMKGYYSNLWGNILPKIK